MRRALVGLGIAVALAVALAVASLDDAPAAPPPPDPIDLPVADRRVAPAAQEEHLREPLAEAPTQALTLEVLGPEGPVAEAQVSLFLASGYTHHGRPMPAARGTTDVNGKVTLDAAIAAGDAPTVSVSAPYFARVQLPFSDGETVKLKPLPLARGRVLLPNRTPAAGARVSNELEPLADTSTDALGSFALKLPWPGALRVEHDTLSARFVGLVTAEAMEQEFEIVLTESPKAKGKVIGRNGAGLAKVEVEVKAGALTKYFATAADGTWSGTLFAGDAAELKYSKPGYLPVTELQRDFAQREEPVMLSRPSKIVGTLVTNEGTTVADAGVMRTRYKSVLTDGQGQFVFKDVDLASVVLEAEVDGAKAAQTVAVPEGQTVTVTLMAPPKLVDVPLLVVDLEGEPTQQWTAAAMPIPARGWESHARAFQGVGSIGLTKGRFRIEVRDDEHALSGGLTVDVDPPGARPIRVVVTGRDGGLGKRLDTDFRAEARVKVRVLTATGAPALDAEVGCVGGALWLGDGVWGCPIYGRDEGAIEIQAETPDGAKAVGHATVTDKELVLTVREARTLRGKVVGTLPPNAQLSITNAVQGGLVPLYSNDFVVPGQPAVRTIVCVHGEFPTMGGLGCAVSVNDDPLEIPIGPLVQVAFKVVDAKGAPIDQPIFFVDRNGTFPEPSASKMLGTVSRGSHVLVVNVSGSKARAERVFTTTGAVTDLGTIVVK